MISSLFYFQVLEKTNATIRLSGDLVMSAFEEKKIPLMSHNALKATPREHWGMYCNQVSSKAQALVNRFVWLFRLSTQ